ncbi:DUF6515 family protein [Mucilaginibacter boryungensis]|uniref:Uncharacterized protein n=1 Tax=Mucilaginibacter boryungensis TaxID=768480 RepID=A0ABR9XMK8_9SPHI|nr:DUF6515 family protein [Mucilaginibacter boryungensis]MBE9668452.1 hypothetical protein [Mucilaginibacter boryungensis]
MKRAYKGISGLLLAGCLIFILTSDANAQRGRGGFHGAAPHIGFGIGFGGPRFGFGFGAYRPYYAYPRVGFYINTLPYGYYPFYWGPDQYFYYGGTFYRPYNNGYEIAAPPIGAAIPKLPSNAHPIMIDGQQYYELNGVYYKESVDDKGKKVYIVSGKDGVLNTNNVEPADDQRPPQVGDVVTMLPEGCRKVTLNGKKYFVSADDIYYEEFTDANNNISYRIASVPEAEEPVKQ